MNPQEAVAVTKQVRAAWPSLPVVDGMGELWADLLSDVPYPIAQEAVRRLIRRDFRHVSIAAIRREAAAMAGLLAPTEEEAWRAAMAVAAENGRGRRELHATVQQTYFDLGGASCLREAGNSLRPQFRDTYRQVAAKYDDEVVSEGMDARILAALTPTPPQLPASPPVAVDQREEPRQLPDPGTLLHAVSH